VKFALETGALGLMVSVAHVFVRAKGVGPHQLAGAPQALSVPEAVVIKPPQRPGTSWRQQSLPLTTWFLAFYLAAKPREQESPQLALRRHPRCELPNGNGLLQNKIMRQ